MSNETYELTGRPDTQTLQEWLKERGSGFWWNPFISVYGRRGALISWSENGDGQAELCLHAGATLRAVKASPSTRPDWSWMDDFISQSATRITQKDSEIIGCLTATDSAEGEIIDRCWALAQGPYGLGEGMSINQLLESREFRRGRALLAIYERVDIYGIGVEESAPCPTIHPLDVTSRGGALRKLAQNKALGSLLNPENEACSELIAAVAHEAAVDDELFRLLMEHDERPATLMVTRAAEAVCQRFVDDMLADDYIFEAMSGHAVPLMSVDHNEKRTLSAVEEGLAIAVNELKSEFPERRFKISQQRAQELAISALGKLDNFEITLADHLIAATCHEPGNALAKRIVQEMRAEISRSGEVRRALRADLEAATRIFAYSVSEICGRMAEDFDLDELAYAAVEGMVSESTMSRNWEMDTQVPFSVRSAARSVCDELANLAEEKDEAPALCGGLEAQPAPDVSRERFASAAER